VHPNIEIGRIEVTEERQPDAQLLGIEPRGGEEIEIFRNPMAELHGYARTAIKDEVRRDSIEFRPQPTLRFRQDVQSRLEECGHLFHYDTAFQGAGASDRILDTWRSNEWTT
jgi:hypothetical protein